MKTRTRCIFLCHRHYYSGRRNGERGTRGIIFLIATLAYIQTFHFAHHALGPPSPLFTNTSIYAHTHTRNYIFILAHAEVRIIFLHDVVAPFTKSPTCAAHRKPLSYFFLFHRFSFLPFFFFFHIRIMYIYILLTLILSLQEGKEIPTNEKGI